MSRESKEEAERTMKVHQYLYYVVAKPVWSDYRYDMFCKEHGLDGGGGSDCADDYPYDVISEAHDLLELYQDP